MSRRAVDRSTAVRRFTAAHFVVTVVVLCVALGLGASAPPFSATPVAAQDDPPTSAPAVSAPDIIPLPNSGREPIDATDRGGWGQYAVLGGIVLAVGLIAALIVRESRQARRSSTRSDPVAETSENDPDSSARQ